jgi:hypothetical protein
LCRASIQYLINESEFETYVAILELCDALLDLFVKIKIKESAARETITLIRSETFKNKFIEHKLNEYDAEGVFD